MKFEQIGIILYSLFFISCCLNTNKHEHQSTSSLQKIFDVSELFSDSAVLQRNTLVNIWGNASPNDEIKIICEWGNELNVITNYNGKWEGRLETPDAGGPFTINILSKHDSIKIKDIMIGEVWLASGQSNMEMPLKGYPPNDQILNSKNEIANANFPNIRMFTVERNFSFEPQNDLNGEWIKASPTSAHNFSATAYFFAKKIHNSLNIPIGIIHSSWGGSPAEAWTSESKLEELGLFQETLDNIKKSDPKIITERWFDKFESINFPEQKYPEDLKENQFKKIEIFDEKFSEFHLDDGLWSETILPGRFDSLVSQQFDGAVWLRKEVLIDDIESDYKLIIGFVDDMDKTFFNGEIIGEHAGYGFRNKKRQYTIPKSLLKKGKNVIAIRAIDTGGPGTIGEPMILTNDEGKTISVKGNWRYNPVAEIYGKKIYIYDQQYSVSDRPFFIKINPFLPKLLFNGMINPIIPFTIRGVIWYQGESNVRRHEEYKYLFPGMINDWRSRWGNDFPFYYVQIAPYRYEGSNISQKLREAQRHALKVPNSGMVVTLDIGNNDNIHPANKQDVGKRLARLALVNDYGFNLNPLGPILNDFDTFGNSIKLTFGHVGNGLVYFSDKINQFEIAGPNKQYHEGSVTIKKNLIFVYSDSVKSPKFVRYAWSDDPEPTLFNAEGFPSSSFMVEID